MVIEPSLMPWVIRNPARRCGPQPFSLLSVATFSTVFGFVLWTDWGALDLGLSPSRPSSPYRFHEL